MESFIKVNGFKENVKDSEFKSGQMAVNMQVNGKTIKPMVKEHYIMLMVMSIKVNGRTTKHVVKVPTPTKMGQNTLVNGKTTNKTGMVSNNGLTVKCTKGNIVTEPKPARAFSNSSTKAIIKANSSITKSTAKVQFNLFRKIRLVLEPKLLRRLVTQQNAW